MTPESFNRLVEAYLRQAEACLGPLGAIHWAFGEYPHFRKLRGFGVTFHYDDIPGTCRMLFAPKLLEQRYKRIEGVLLHEIGHVLDYMLSPVELEVFAAKRGQLLPPRGAEEIRADAIARAVFQKKISYDSELVQTTGAGSGRPVHLGW